MGEAMITRTLTNSSSALVVQETGTSETSVMSQKAVTDELQYKVDKVEGKGLSSEDFTVEDKEKLDTCVPQTRTINSKPLSDNIILTAEDIGALPGTTIVATKTSELENDSGFLNEFTETDPTVPAWAKTATKPKYTASEVNAVPTTRTVNGKALSENISLIASDVGAASSDHTHAVEDITSGTLPVSMGGTGVASLTSGNILLGNGNGAIASTSTISVSKGGTGATTASSARMNLSVYSKSEVDDKLIATSLGKLLYPVGSIYLSVNSTNPQNVFGGTWVSWGSGRVPVGVNSSDGDFSTVEKTGGEKAVLLDDLTRGSYTSGHEAPGLGLVESARFDSRVMVSYGIIAHNNLQPYITCYMWKRTA